MNKSNPVPEGFSEVVGFPDHVSWHPTKHFADDGYHKDLVFNVTEKVPALPFKGRGWIRHIGWDIPTYWVIDATGQAWKDNAHGHPLEPVTAASLIAECQEESDRRKMQLAMGLPVDRPSWILTALANGWVPPVGWKDPTP